MEVGKFLGMVKEELKLNVTEEKTTGGQPRCPFVIDDRLDCKGLEYQPKGSGLSLVVRDHAKVISRGRTGSEVGSKRDGLKRRHTGGRSRKMLL